MYGKLVVWGKLGRSLWQRFYNFLFGAACNLWRLLLSPTSHIISSFRSANCVGYQGTCLDDQCLLNTDVLVSNNIVVSDM